jgi:hypothetical protein
VDIKDSKVGIKFDQGRARYDLIPVYPLLLLAKLYGTGAKKYADHNWLKGIEHKRLYAALQRHANAYWAGLPHDLEDKQHHLISVIWNAMALIEMDRLYPELDDRPEMSKYLDYDKEKILQQGQLQEETASPKDQKQRKSKIMCRERWPLCLLWRKK